MIHSKQPAQVGVASHLRGKHLHYGTVQHPSIAVEMTSLPQLSNVSGLSRDQGRISKEGDQHIAILPLNTSVENRKQSVQESSRDETAALNSATQIVVPDKTGTLKLSDGDQNPFMNGSKQESFKYDSEKPSLPLSIIKAETQIESDTLEVNDSRIDTAVGLAEPLKQKLEQVLEERQMEGIQSDPSM